MVEEDSKRFLSKDFQCQNCKCQFKKLVNFNNKTAECPKCSFRECIERNNTVQMSQDERIRKHLMLKVTPFSVSPFCRSVKRSHTDFSNILDDDLITTPTEDFFIDNYASNFISNFNNPMSRIVFIQSQANNTNKEQSLPLQTKLYKKIKIITMSQKFCKVNPTDNSVELPNCFLCLKDIQLNSKSVLLRCGHLYHYNCIMEWLKKHSVCSICKFDAIIKNIHKSSIDIVQEKENEIKKNTVLPKESENSKMFNGENINIIGETRYIY